MDGEGFTEYELPTLPGSRTEQISTSSEAELDEQNDPEVYGEPRAFTITREVPVSEELLRIGAESDDLIARIFSYFEVETYEEGGEGEEDLQQGEDRVPSGDDVQSEGFDWDSKEPEDELEIAAIDVHNLPYKVLIDGELTYAQVQRLNYSYGIFNRLIPERWRNDIAKLYVIEGSETAAYVNYDVDDDRKLLLGINIDEMIDPSHSALDHYALITLFFHEFAHIFSMDTDQALPGGPCYEPLGETFDCYKKDSYLNQFNDLFWSNVDPYYRENIGKPDDVLLAFYERNADNFLNDYAASNPYEDFAESFVAFVTEYAPENQSDGISKKILFFYQFPELVELRAELLKTLVEIVDERILRGIE